MAEESESKSLLSSELAEITADTSPSFAKLRWNMISKAVHDTSCLPSQPQMGSIRRFTSFGLIGVRQLYATNGGNSHTDCHDRHTSALSSLELIDERQVCDEKGRWYECVLDHNNSCVVDIRILSEKIPLQELLHGFDNTGNICLWPSEEVLAYYLFKNREICANKTVCELGGGMTCLSGLIVAAFGSAKQVVLTDGNERSIANIKAIVERNEHRFSTSVVCKQLRWGNDSDISDMMCEIDVIVCSDCLYFDGSRQQLIDTIWKLLKTETETHNSGIAILLAPTRGTTLQNFVDLAQTKFYCQLLTRYDNTVWQLHQHFLNTLKPPFYVNDLHYPYMILLRKRTEPH